MSKSFVFLFLLVIAQLLLLGQTFTVQSTSLLLRRTVPVCSIHALSARVKSEDAATIDDDAYLSFTIKYISSKLMTKAKQGESIPYDDLLQLQSSMDAVLAAAAAPPSAAPAKVTPPPAAASSSKLPPLRSSAPRTQTRSKSPTEAQIFGMEYVASETTAEYVKPTPAPVPAPRAAAPAAKVLTPAEARAVVLTGPSTDNAAVGSYQKKLQERQARKEAIAKGLPVPPLPRAIPRIGTVIVTEGLTSSDPGCFKGEDLIMEDSPLEMFKGLESSWSLPGEEDMTTEEFYRAVVKRNQFIRGELQKKFKSKEPAKEYLELLSAKRSQAQQ